MLIGLVGRIKKERRARLAEASGSRRNSVVGQKNCCCGEMLGPVRHDVLGAVSELFCLPPRGRVLNTYLFPVHVIARFGFYQIRAGRNLAQINRCAGVVDRVEGSLVNDFVFVVRHHQRTGFSELLGETQHNAGGIGLRKNVDA